MKKRVWIALTVFLLIFSVILPLFSCTGGSGTADTTADIPTGAPTDAPDEEPTENPTETPTEEPTEAPTEPETEYLAALDDMAAAALVDGCTATNPRTPNKEEIIEIYKKIW